MRAKSSFVSDCRYNIVVLHLGGQHAVAVKCARMVVGRLTACKFLIVESLVGTGCGDRAFSSGAALKGDGEHFTVHIPPHVVDDYEKRKMVPQPSTIQPADMVMARQTIAFWDFPKPLVMAVNGLAVGGGANIALANYADIVICSSTARFKYPFSTLGLTPELGSSSLIPFVVGMAKAKEMMMLGVRVACNNS